MNKRQNDIGDDEIRIISADSGPKHPQPEPAGGPRRSRRLPVIAVLCAVLLGAVLYGWLKPAGGDSSDQLIVQIEPSADVKEAMAAECDSVTKGQAYVDMADTTVNGVELLLFTPRNATPSLHVGPDALNTADAVMVVQAADVRRDNGQIVGAYVSKGRLLSKGKSKSGFCAIIGGTPIIGVADATPYLEQAIESDGYFFRQYPLVVGKQMVENKLQSKSLRKALAELNGETVVVMSQARMTLNEFAQTLVDLGVSNAIYLVGSTSFGFAIGRDNKRFLFGDKRNRSTENTNYLIWR